MRRKPVCMSVVRILFSGGLLAWLLAMQGCGKPRAREFGDSQFVQANI